MSSLDLEEFGFTPQQIAKLPKNFVNFLSSHYNEVELKTLSVEALMKSGSILYSVYHPNEHPVLPKDILGA